MLSSHTPAILIRAGSPLERCIDVTKHVNPNFIVVFSVPQGKFFLLESNSQAHACHENLPLGMCLSVYHITQYPIHVDKLIYWTRTFL